MSSGKPSDNTNSPIKNPFATTVRTLKENTNVETVVRNSKHGILPEGFVSKYAATGLRISLFYSQNKHSYMSPNPLI